MHKIPCRQSLSIDSAIVDPLRDGPERIDIRCGYWTGDYTRVIPVRADGSDWRLFAATAPSCHGLTARRMLELMTAPSNAKRWRRDQLIDATAIGVRLGFTRQTVGYYLRKYADFPAPLHEFGPPQRRLRIWAWPEVEDWAIYHGLLKTRYTRTAEEVDYDVDELLNATQIAELVGWKSPSTAGKMTKAGTFPQPSRLSSSTKLWWRSEVEHWAATHSRNPGRRNR